VDHLSDYRKKTGKMMPRLLLIVDEFQQFFIEDDVVASQASRLLDRLVRQGRSFGIHVILGSQSLAGAYSLARSTIDQMAVRIALQCSDADSRLILSDENNAARLLDRPGEAIYNDTNGLVEGNIRFQTVWLPDDEQLIILKQVSQLHSAVKTGWRTVVFEGRELARFDQVLTLESQLVCRTWQAAPRSLLAWLGEPIAISDQPLAARLQPQSRANLLIVGQDESAAVGMLTSSVISLALQASPDEVRFCLLDLTTADMDNEDAARRLVDYLPHPIQVVRRNREIELLLDELGELVRSRQEEITSAPPKPAIFLVVLGLHRAHNLRRAADNSSWYHTTSGEIAPPPNPAERFATLLQDGPEIGVHTLAWCSTFASLERTLDRRSIAEFGLRVAMQMNAEASTQLLDSSAASKLGANRAIFFDEEQIGRLQKFRPFAQPAIDWLEALSERLQQWVVRKTE
jgi:S-DNA-T family DNA segregation ATPase FtsK/SpoIIIE